MQLGRIESLANYSILSIAQNQSLIVIAGRIRPTQNCVINYIQLTHKTLDSYEKTLEH